MELAQKLINKVDEVKKKLSDKDYKQLCDLLQELSVKPKEDLYELKLKYYTAELTIQELDQDLGPRITIKGHSATFQSTLVDQHFLFRPLMTTNSIKVTFEQFKELTSSKVNISFNDGTEETGVDYPDLEEKSVSRVWVQLPRSTLKIIKKLT